MNRNFYTQLSFLSLVLVAAVGCSKPVVAAPKPMSPEDISREAISSKPIKIIEKRLIALNLLPTDTIATGSNLYRVYVAETPAESVEGLTNVEPGDLPPDTGMLLIFPSGQAPAVTTDHTFIDLDVVYIDPNADKTKGVIKAINSQRADAQTPLPARTAHFVLLMRMGDAARLKMKVGDEVLIRSNLLQTKEDVSPTATKTNAQGTAPANNGN